jgi:hypothetical protein
VRFLLAVPMQRTQIEFGGSWSEPPQEGKDSLLCK